MIVLQSYAYYIIYSRELYDKTIDKIIYAPNYKNICICTNIADKVNFCRNIKNFILFCPIYILYFVCTYDTIIKKVLRASHT